MRQSTLLRTGVLVALVLAVAVVSSGCGGGGKQGSKDIYMQKFLLVDQELNNIGGSGATNAFRDTRILFVFNVPVDPASISDRTIRIGIPTGDGLLLEAPGRFDVVAGHPNWVLFDPTFTSNNVTDVHDNPFGLDANALYEVHIPSAADSAKHIMSDAGKGIVQAFDTTFKTSDVYIQNFVQPELVDTMPLDGETGVSPTADVILDFSAPMKPDTFKLGETVFVRDLTNDLDVLGQLRFSADAKRVTFRPIFGYGKGPNVIFVRVKTDASNLPGNPLSKEVRFTFTTAKDNTQPDFKDITEEFTSNDQEDTGFTATYPLANWNKGVTAGLLAGGFTSGTNEQFNSAVTTYLWAPFCWGGNYTGQFQYVVLSSEIGSSRTITGLEWYYRAVNGAQTVTGVTVNIGHTKQANLTTSFASNFSDTPVTVISNLNAYNIPSSPSEGWLKFPNFTQNFKFNGTDNMLVEIYDTCGPNGQSNGLWYGLWRLTNTNAPTKRAAYTVPPSVGSVPVSNPYGLAVRVNYLIDLTEAQSLWYDTGLSNPQFLDAVLFPSLGNQPAGTSTTIEFQGGVVDPANPSQPDPDTTSDWTSDLTKLSGYQFVRFHVVLKGNETTFQVPQFDYLILPFIYF
jgi:hypothetical protein